MNPHSHVSSGHHYASKHYSGHHMYDPHKQRMKQHHAAQQSSCPSGPETAAYYPYGHAAAAFDMHYPNAENEASKYPRGCASQGAHHGYELSIDSLMPASWKQQGSKCATQGTGAVSQWSKYAPSKAAFDRYITAAGSVRLGLNTRSPPGS